MPRAVHFDMTAEDPERAVKFYAHGFDWTAQKWKGGGMPYVGRSTTRSAICPPQCCHSFTQG